MPAEIAKAGDQASDRARPRIRAIAAYAIVGACVLGIAIVAPLVVAELDRKEIPAYHVDDDGKLRDFPEALRRAHAIDAELARAGGVGPSWEARYVTRGGFGSVVVVIAPGSGAVAIVRTDTMGFFAYQGPVAIRPDGSLHIAFEESPHFGVADDFYPVAWSERHYLIPKADMPGFVAAIRHGIEPSDAEHIGYLLMQDGEFLTVNGGPVLPRGFDERVDFDMEAANARIAKVAENFRKGRTTRTKECEWRWLEYGATGAGCPSR